MKFSLKEFFLREYEVVNKSSTRKSSTNIEINVEHQERMGVKQVGSSAWSNPAMPVDVKHFFSHDGVLSMEDSEIDEMGGPGSGRGKGTKNRRCTGCGNTAMKCTCPNGPSLPPWPSSQKGWRSAKKAAKSGAQVSGDMTPAETEFDSSPFAREDGDLGDELSWLDDPNLGKGVEVPDRPEPIAKSDKPKKNAKPKQPWPKMDDYDEDGDLIKSYGVRDLLKHTGGSRRVVDMLGDVVPTMQTDREMALGAKFYTDQRGTTFMQLPDGARWTYTDNAGWKNYDDDSSQEEDGEETSDEEED